MKNHLQRSGFTLAELLIALAILGVIATFTIPKILDSGREGQHNAAVQEAIATVANMYALYQTENGVPPTNLRIKNLTPYLKYVRKQTYGLIDNVYTGTSKPCANNNDHECFVLHSGAILRTDGDYNFGSSDPTAAIIFWVDPDGKYSGTTNGAGKSTPVFLYYDGLIRTQANIFPNTHVHVWSGTSVYNPNPNYVPPYFKWGK